MAYKAGKERQLKTDYLLQQEVDRVLALLTPQNRLVMRTCLATGLRVGDVLALTPDQLKPNFWITESKTGKRKQVGLPAPLLKDLKEAAGTRWVFEGRDWRQPRTRQAVWKDLKRAAEALRMPQNIGTHSARKIYAVQLMEKYGDIAKVRKALNHSADGVTMIYAMADKIFSDKYKRRRSSRRKKV